MRVAITGAGGLLGGALVGDLVRRGHEILRLVRRPPSAPNEIRWKPAAGELDVRSLAGVDAVVHLAGEGIATGRWTAAKKRRLHESRVGPTRRLSEVLLGLDPPPRVLVSASAIGYYGDRGAEWLTEESQPGAGFLAELARDWEGATEAAERGGLRVACLRTGVVLSRAGGALARMLLPFRLGLGGRLGGGQQYWSWIALDDWVGGVVHVLTGDLRGPVNLVAPEPATNAEFTATLGRVLHRPTPLPAPAWLLRLALGEMADGALLASARVRPRRLLDAGYAFAYSSLEPALLRALGRG